MDSAKKAIRDVAETAVKVARDAKSGLKTAAKDLLGGGNRAARRRTVQSRRSKPRPTPRKRRAGPRGGPSSGGRVDEVDTRPQREFIGHVAGSTGFAYTTYGISPLNTVMFPVLSNKARNYELYRFKKLRFIFKSTSGSISSTAALGYMGMGVTYDPSDPLLSSEADMLNYDGGRSFKPWNIDTAKEMSVNYDVGSGPLSWRYVQHDNNLNFSELGTFYTFTNGNPGTSGVALLYVEYECEFKKLRTAPGSTTTHIISIATSSNSVNYGLVPKSSSAGYSRADNGALLMSLAVSNTITFLQPGYHHVTITNSESNVVATSGEEETILLLQSCTAQVPVDYQSEGAAGFNEMYTTGVASGGGAGTGILDGWFYVPTIGVTLAPSISASSNSWSAIAASTGNVTITDTLYTTLPTFSAPLYTGSKSEAALIDATIERKLAELGYGAPKLLTVNTDSPACYVNVPPARAVSRK